MPTYKLARYQVRPEARDLVERAMHDCASYVRGNLPGTMWTVYRDRENAGSYLALLRNDSPAAESAHAAAPGIAAFTEVMEPFLIASEESSYEVVTSSDLQRRHPSGRRR